jgi:hypothetical protein
MLGVILFALFAISASAATIVLVDSFMRGREAFARLRRELAQAEPGGRILVTIQEFANDARLPAPRAQIIRLGDVLRSGDRRRAPMRKPPLAAAA